MEPRRRFRIIKELSEGAFGKVYLAEMITGDNFKSVVAIKLLHGKWAGHEEIVQRSRDEARVLGLIHHRNIIRVEDLTSINGQCAVVMEYLNGVDMKTLCTYARERNIHVPRRVILEVAAQIASALDAAYTHRPLQGGEPLELIHRDIKPSNVMLTCAGEVKVLDFGTAQARFDHREAQTQALAFGSAAYMAPERLLGDQDQPWGDIFSLGVTVYEMLSLKSYGKIQVRPEKNAEHLVTCLSELTMDDLVDKEATELKAFLSRMLSYEPEDRPSAMEVVEFMEDLADRIHDGTVRRFCREVVTPCREMVEPEQDPNDPLAGSTLFEDTTTIAEHATVVGGNWMDETEEEDSQASSLRSLGVDKGHLEIENANRKAGAAGHAEHQGGRGGSSIHPLAVPEPTRSNRPVQSGATWVPDDDQKNELIGESTEEENSAAVQPPETAPNDPDLTGPVPIAKSEIPSHTPLAVDCSPSPSHSGLEEPRTEETRKNSIQSAADSESASAVEDGPTETPAMRASEKASANSDGLRLPEDLTTSNVLESVLEPEMEPDEFEGPKPGGKRALMGLLAGVFMVGGLGLAGWQMGLFGPSKSTEQSEEDEDEEDESDEKVTKGPRSDEGQSESRPVLRGGNEVSLGQSPPGEGGSLSLQIKGDVQYVLVGSPLDRVWDGEGTLTLTETLAKKLTVNVQVEGSASPVVFKLVTWEKDQVCYEYDVETSEKPGEIQCLE